MCREGAVRGEPGAQNLLRLCRRPAFWEGTARRRSCRRSGWRGLEHVRRFPHNPTNPKQLHGQVLVLLAIKLNAEAATIGDTPVRQSLIEAFETIMFVVGYFLLVDFARPALLQRGLSAIWWIVLLLYVLLLLAGVRDLLKSRPYFVGVGFLLLTAGVFSYDPMIQSRLALLGLSWIWIAFVGASVLWWVAGVGRKQSR